MKRHKIISFITNDRFNYKVSEEINETLDRLSFNQLSSSQLADWDMFTRENPREFVGIHKNDRYLIKGNYENIKTPQSDLEIISKYIFNSGWLSKNIREKSVISIFIPPAALVGLTAYDMLDEKSDLINNFNTYLNSVLNLHDEMAAMKALLLGMAGAMIAIPSAISTTGNLLNRHYGSKLSKQAEDYIYGEIAEENLRDECIFEKIQAGEMTKQDFLNLKEDLI